VAKSLRSQWKPLIEGYLLTSPQLRGVVQLIDIRHAPTAEDLQMLDFLAELGAPTIVALTKSDKLTQREAGERTIAITKEIGLSDEQVIAFSAETGEGRQELTAAIVSLVTQPAWRTL
jgi:GTP-binding protein